MLWVWMTCSGDAADALRLVLLALLIDVAVGDPAWLYRRVAHPVALLGRAISAAEHRLYPREDAGGAFWHGLLLTAGLVGIAAALGAMLSMLLWAVPGGWLAEAAFASSLIACRSLHMHGAAVADGLDLSLDEGRAAVSHIVGRNPDSLDRGGVARAAVESIAENFSDGVVAPLFWLALLGLPGLLAYKTINTLDSMIGHRSTRYLLFGRAAAKLDDWVNWLPARLAGVVIAAAAVFMPGANAVRAWRTMNRDARKHRSPNAGWQEAAMAGALGFALAGPRQYGAEIIDDVWMGDGRSDLEAADIRAALRLYRWACGLMALTAGAAWLSL